MTLMDAILAAISERRPFAVFPMTGEVAPLADVLDPPPYGAYALEDEE